MTRGWWRRNAVPLSILAVLLPASFASIGWREWSEATNDDFDRTLAVTAGDDDTVDLSDTTWGPVRSGVITELDGLDVPPGTKVVAAAILVDSSADSPVACGSPLLVQQSTGTQWSEMSAELGLPYNPDEPARCVSDTEGPYEIIVPFVVPEEAEGPFWIDVIPYGAAGSFVRFSIDP